MRQQINVLQSDKEVLHQQIEKLSNTSGNLLNQEVVKPEQILSNIPGIAPSEVETVSVEVGAGAIAPEQTPDDQTDLLLGVEVCKLLGVEDYQVSKMSDDKIKAKGFERVKVGKKSKYRKLDARATKQR